MVVRSLGRTNKRENGIHTGHSLENGVAEGNTKRQKCKEVSGNNSESPAVERRISARIQKMKSEKALRVREREESSDHIEERVARKKTKVYERRKVNPPEEPKKTKVHERKNVNPPHTVVHDNKGSEGKVLILGSNESKNSANADGVQDAVTNMVLTEVAESGIGIEKSAHAKVTETLRTFNKLYLHFVQQGKAPADDTKRGSKRPDLKAISKMKETNAILYPDKRIGPIPGIDVGHQFYSRAEMVAIGFHSHWLNGIDYIGKSAGKQYSNYKLPITTAIVMSGHYEDDLDNCDDIVYTGQGGNDLLGNKRQKKDQVMTLGNLGLKNCIDQDVLVRVVRGHQSAHSYVKRVYTYDGLYKVVKYWAEKGVSGFTVYKFSLKRLEGQPLLTTNQVQFSRGRIPNSISEIRGLVCEDISWGQEGIPIPATNLVDDQPIAPTGFTYCKSMQVRKSVKLPSNAPGCGCEGTCVDPKRCACARLNGSDFPYVHRDGGRLIEPKAVVFECGPNCGCGPECVNRTSQKGMRYRLEVFCTPKKGWGVRSWDFIPSGAPVCEYIGVLMKTDEVDPASENNYVFDIDCLQTMKGLDGRESRLRDVSIPLPLDKSDDQKSDCVPEFCIDAGSSGNISRFINHSCQPNLFVQCVLSSHHDIKQARIVLFAADNIPPLKELTYDYGYVVDGVLGPDGKIRQMACYCGAEDCRKRLL
ncbi:histone-lysine N-methyltransferase, H3 lysine-9 specific SUVH4-like isoform X3 [Actinidia eriantha]|uniref:histone-lysine N-methyltransferase, H3 lysine-9 specific SUVH4-like isoform X3 n=1 Tax=Actinidia eriantha TaxID=165200 RepID=UPI00258B79D1|nr:histone-lysine N-methyltransferase, H3 lysine-9 specific SUVH4-like isoform X3 [Actinidia eriantha]